MRGNNGPPATPSPPHFPFRPVASRRDNLIDRRLAGSEFLSVGRLVFIGVLQGGGAEIDWRPIVARRLTYRQEHAGRAVVKSRNGQRHGVIHGPFHDFSACVADYFGWANICPPSTFSTVPVR